MSYMATSHALRIACKSISEHQEWTDVLAKTVDVFYEDAEDKLQRLMVSNFLTLPLTTGPVIITV